MHPIDRLRDSVDDCGSRKGPQGKPGYMLHGKAFQFGAEVSWAIVTHRTRVKNKNSFRDLEENLPLDPTHAKDIVSSIDDMILGAHTIASHK